MPGMQKTEVSTEEEIQLPAKIEDWRKPHYYYARKVNDQHFKEAVDYLGKKFANVTDGQRNDKAATLLTRLLKSCEPQTPAASSSGMSPGMGPGMGPGMSPGMGPGMNSGPGMSGPSGAQDSASSKVMPPITIFAVVQALAINQSNVAKQTLKSLLAGTFSTDNDTVATLAALGVSVIGNTPDSENLLFALATTPEQVRPPKTDAASQTTNTSPMPGMMGSSPGMMGMPGMSGGRNSQLTTAQLQMIAIVLIEKTGSEQLRTRLAESLASPQTPAPLRLQLTNLLLGPDPRNVRAQILLQRNSTLDAKIKTGLEFFFLKYSSDAMASLMGVPFQTPATLANRKAGTSGMGGPGMMPGMGTSGMGGPGMPGMASGTGSGMGLNAGSDPMRTAMTSGSSMPGMSGNMGGNFQGLFGGMDANTVASIMGTLPISGNAPGANDKSAAGAISAVKQLWNAEFIASLGGQLDQLDSLEQEPQKILLASTIPTDAARAKLYQIMMRHQSKGFGARALEMAGLGTDVFSDPGFLIVLKSMPRKDPSLTSTPTRNTSRSRQPVGSNPGGGQPQAAEAEKPEYAWMNSSERLSRAMCDFFLAPAKQQLAAANPDAADKRPFELPPKVDRIGEYHLDWPGQTAGKDALGSIAADPMSVHYIRFQVNSSPAKVLSYFKRNIGKSSEHLTNQGFWLESFRAADKDPARKLSIDIFVMKASDADKPTAKPANGAGGPGGMSGPGMGPMGDAGAAYGRNPSSSTGGNLAALRAQQTRERETRVDLTVEILIVETKNPTGIVEAPKTPKARKPAAKPTTDEEEEEE
jgi:hypothetical protein